MAAVGGNIIVRFTYTGEEDIPRDATHITIVNVRVVCGRTFERHENIVEIICHEDVEKIESYAFYRCPRLRRVIMPGVTIVEFEAFYSCRALTDVECGNLERIGYGAFQFCNSLRGINLPSVRIVKKFAFAFCKALADAQFSNKLERFEEKAFRDCTSLERITIPLKDGIIATDNIFQGCGVLNRVDLVEGALHETIAALYLEEWREDTNEEIDSIHQILPNAGAGGWDYDTGGYDDGEKAEAIRTWIRSVIHKIIRYKAEHQGILGEAAATLELELALPQDMVMNNVLPFLELPSYTFEIVGHPFGRGRRPRWPGDEM